jgi:hypothetical protein
LTAVELLGLLLLAVLSVAAGMGFEAWREERRARRWRIGRPR